MGKKRTSLDTVLVASPKRVGRAAVPAPSPAPPVGKRPGVKQQTVYLPLPVHDQLRRLAFEERVSMHDLLIEGLDRVFRDRGLPPVDGLVAR